MDNGSANRDRLSGTGVDNLSVNAARPQRVLPWVAFATFVLTFVIGIPLALLVGGIVAVILYAVGVR